MTETTFRLMLLLSLAGAVVAGLWIADVAGVRDSLRTAARACGCVCTVAAALGLVSLVLFGVVRLIRLGWGP